MDGDDKVLLKYSNDKTIGRIYKGFSMNGGKDKDFYNMDRRPEQQNKEHGIGTDSKYSNLSAVLLYTDIKIGSRKQLKEAFGVTREADEQVKIYLSITKETEKKPFRPCSQPITGQTPCGTNRLTEALRITTMTRPSRRGPSQKRNGLAERIILPALPKQSGKPRMTSTTAGA